VATTCAPGRLYANPDRPHTALLVVDVQNAALERAHERDTVVANVGGPVERARREGCRWSGSSIPTSSLLGSDAWQIVPELTPDFMMTIFQPLELGDDAFDRLLADAATELTTLKEVLERP
jgi:nicotinamidase-related amidase